jgi:hypothetical protein
MFIGEELPRPTLELHTHHWLMTHIRPRMIEATSEALPNNKRAASLCGRSSFGWSTIPPFEGNVWWSPAKHQCRVKRTDSQIRIQTFADSINSPLTGQDKEKRLRNHIKTATKDAPLST